MKSEHPTISISIEHIPDFLAELKEGGVKKVYRYQESRSGRHYRGHTSHDGAIVKYTAWDPERRVFVKAEVTFPEIAEMTEMTMYRGWYGGNWNFGQNVADIELSSKSKLMALLKRFEVDADILRDLRNATVESINRTIDQSEGEHESQFVRYKKDGVLERKISVNALGGLIKEAVIRIEQSHGDMKYKLVINNWRPIMTAIRERNEIAFTEAGLKLIDGSIDLR